MTKNDIEEIFLQLDELKKFFYFKRGETVGFIKKSLETFYKDNVELYDDYQRLQNNYNDTFKKLEKNKTILQDTYMELDDLQTKFTLIRDILGAKNIVNNAFEDFKSLIENDFLEFANEESSLAEEAKAILLLKDIEKRVEEIVRFPSIYNKNILAVGGGFSAGKSEFLNSFFKNKEIKLPVGINPVTAIPTYIIKGKKNLIKGYSYKGGVVDISPKVYSKLSHDFIKSIGFNLRDIVPVMAIETDLLSYKNICFIDTPGYNPSNTGYTQNDKDASKEYLEHANTLLWMIGIDTNGTIPSSDLDFLENLSLENKKIYIIANKADLRTNDDIKNILDEFEKLLNDYDIEYEGISAFSSVLKKEFTYRKESIFYFLDRVNKLVKIKKDILAKLEEIFDMYDKAIEKDLKWIKQIKSHFNSLELDLLQIGVDIGESEILDKRLKKLKNMFDSSHLNSQKKELKKLKDKMTMSVNEIFKTFDKG
jgi:GTPase SAR1 family protein